MSGVWPPYKGVARNIRWVWRFRYCCCTPMAPPTRMLHNWVLAAATAKGAAIGELIARGDLRGEARLSLCGGTHTQL